MNQPQPLKIGIELPYNYVTQKGSILGVTGSGKSNGAGCIMEEMAKQDIPFILADVAGAHKGITETYPKVKYVDCHDYAEPSEVYHAMLKLINNPSQSFIVDLHHYNDKDMQTVMSWLWVALFDLHSQIRTPRHVFVEEAEVFCPQVNYDNAKTSLMALNRIMKRGRAFGLGCTLISQRPQDVNKKTLSQSQCTFLLNLTGLQELKVVHEILKSDPDRKELVAKVERFQQGECLIYSPSYLRGNQVFKFRKKETKHYGDTPELMDPPKVHPKNIKVIKGPNRMMSKQVTAGMFLFSLALLFIAMTL